MQRIVFVHGDMLQIIALFHSETDLDQTVVKADRQTFRHNLSRLCRALERTCKNGIEPDVCDPARNYLSLSDAVCI